jgi:hypothetical protein
MTSEPRVTIAPSPALQDRQRAHALRETAHSANLQATSSLALRRYAEAAEHGLRALRAQGELCLLLSQRATQAAQEVPDATR